jgi:hypothetical protein
MNNLSLFRLPCAAALVGLLLIIASPGHANASPFTLVSASPKTLTSAMIAVAEKSDTRGQIFANKKALAFYQKVIRLVAVTGPDNDMLSSRIDGLRNPTLIVPRRAVLHVLFVNEDDDMFHNIRFGKALKSYPNTMSFYMRQSTGAQPLPHKANGKLHGEMMILRAPSTPGQYAYLCTVRGHAHGGMAGTLITR